MKATRACSVPDCQKTAKPGYVDPMCPMHRERLRLHGSTDNHRPLHPRQRWNGYWVFYDPTHPLVMPSSGYVLEHRVALWDAIGPGDHPCHWCGVSVSWMTPFPDGLVADHLDGTRDNNDSTNLVPSCMVCNCQRPAREMTACVHGHAYTRENTRMDGNRRRCRACSSAVSARYSARKKMSASN